MKSLGPVLLIVVGLLLVLAGPAIDQLLPKPQHPDAWVIVVEQTEDRSPVVARLQSDTNWWENLESRRLHWRFYDADSPDAVQYAERVKESGTPALLIVATDGTVLDARPLPATIDGLEQIVSSTTGM
jgi:hypothetical protein